MQSQSSHVEDQDSRSSPDSEGKQENTKSSQLEIKEAGVGVSIKVGLWKSRAGVFNEVVNKQMYKARSYFHIRVNF